MSPPLCRSSSLGRMRASRPSAMRCSTSSISLAAGMNGFRLSPQAEAKAVASRRMLVMRAGAPATQAGFITSGGKRRMCLRAPVVRRPTWNALSWRRERGFAIRLRGLAFQLTRDYSGAIANFGKCCALGRRGQRGGSVDRIELSRSPPSSARAISRRRRRIFARRCG